MSKKGSVKRKVYLFFSDIGFVFRKWSIQKKLHVSLLTLIGILGFNALMTAYEITRLKEYDLKLSYLIYLDFIGILCGGLFIWMLTNSVIRRMRKMVDQIENRTFLEAQNIYSSDEIGELARAVSFMKKNHMSTGEVLEEKNRLIQAILDHSMDSIFLFNEKGQITSYSKTFKEIFKLEHKKDPTLHLSTLLPSISVEKIKESFKDKKLQKDYYTDEFFALNRLSETLKVKCSIFPIEMHKKVHFVGIIRSQKKTQRFKNFVFKYMPKTPKES